MKKFVLILLLFVAGCATGEFEMVKADINQLKKDSFDIKKETSEITAVKTELDNLKDRSAKDALETKSAFKAELADLKDKSLKEDSLNAIREGMVSLRLEVSGISKDLQSLTGRFDENKYFIDKAVKDKSLELDLLRAQITTLETQAKEMQTKLSAKTDLLHTQITELETQVKEIQTKLSAKTETDTTVKDKPDVKKENKTETEERMAPEAKTPEVKDPVKVYGAAYDSFKDKKYKEAREKFDAFKKEFPKDKLTGNAQFWIAEAYYSEEDYAGAIVEYDALLKNYPSSEKAPGALLKQGYSFIEMGDNKAARGILEELKEKYPKSKEAALAKKKLEEISKKGNK